MNKKSIEIVFEEYDSITNLDKHEQELFAAAHFAAKNAYAPYSEFKVGCSLLLNDGSIIKGNNQENMAYPSGLCAERVALFSAGALFPQKKIVMLAVVTANNNLNVNDIFSPCGACRQVMQEYEQKQKEPIVVLMEQPNKKIIKFLSASMLLPFSFGVSMLQKKH
jgi:cytidine deaminase